jgi:hypothetical protein
VAIRISRPQASEDEFLEQELDTVTRTGVTLLGAQPRPQGVVLRFEIVLASGTIVLRGEGRVVAFRPNVHQGLGGLSLRFTRLDTKSKALVDKANALRERRRPSGHPSSPPPLPVEASPPPRSVRPGPPPLPASVRAPDPPPAPSPADTSPEPPPAEPSGPELPIASDPSPLPPPLPPQVPSPAPRTATNGHSTPSAQVKPPAARDALLERLRTRAKSLDESRVRSILDPKARPT